MIHVVAAIGGACLGLCVIWHPSELKFWVAAELGIICMAMARAAL